MSMPPGKANACALAITPHDVAARVAASCPSTETEDGHPNQARPDQSSSCCSDSTQDGLCIPGGRRRVPVAVPALSLCVSPDESPKDQSESVAATLPALSPSTPTYPECLCAPSTSAHGLSASMPTATASPVAFSPPLLSSDPPLPSKPVVCDHMGDPCVAVPWQSTSTAPFLLLDTRPSHIYMGCRDSQAMTCLGTGHIQGAINVQIPSLLLRRMQRALANQPEMLDTMDVVSFIHLPSNIKHDRSLYETQRTHSAAASVPQDTLEALMRAYWFLDVLVLYEDDTSALAGHLLLKLIAALRTRVASLASQSPQVAEARHGLYYVPGGMRTLRETPESLAWFRVLDAEPSQEDEDTSIIATPGPVDATSSFLSSFATSTQEKMPSPLRLLSSHRPSLPRLRTSSGPAPPLPLVARRHTTREGSRMSKASHLHVATTAMPTMTRFSDGALFDEPQSAREIYDVLTFDVSTIIPNELYLGPDIQTPDNVMVLRTLGVRAIINTAQEVEDGGTPELQLRQQFEEYLYLPMHDSVEADGVQTALNQACSFLDIMHERGLPTYVHCRAGKSRSAMIVMAYLMHQRRWRLQQAYAYVTTCRPDASPNIGFIAELMHFERTQHPIHQQHDALPSATARSVSLPPPM